MTRTFLGAALATVLLAGPALGQAGKDPTTTLAETAALLSREGDLDGALKLYQKAYDLSHEPILLYNMARILDRKGDLATARGMYERYLAEEKDPKAATRGKEKYEALLDRLPGRLSVTTTPPGAAVEVDGAGWGVSPAGPADLKRGRHTVRVALEGFEAATQEVEVRPGETATATLLLKAVEVVPVVQPAPLPPVPAPVPPVTVSKASPGRPPSVWTWVCLGAGGALLATGGVLTYLAHADRVKVTGASKDADGNLVGVTRARALEIQDSADRKSAASIGMYVAGGVAVAGGVVLWIVTGRPAVSASAVPVPGGAVLGATGRF